MWELFLRKSSDAIEIVVTVVVVPKCERHEKKEPLLRQSKKKTEGETKRIGVELIHSINRITSLLA